jgi:hypothetical protein
MKFIKDEPIRLTPFEVVLIFFILMLMGYIGYLAQRQQPQYLNGGVNSQSPVAQDVSKAPAIQNAGDLSKASTVLDKNDPAANSLDAKQLDSESSGL